MSQKDERHGWIAVNGHKVCCAIYFSIPWTIEMVQANFHSLLISAHLSWSIQSVPSLSPNQASLPDWTLVQKFKQILIMLTNTCRHNLTILTLHFVPIHEFSITIPTHYYQYKIIISKDHGYNKHCSTCGKLKKRRHINKGYIDLSVQDSCPMSILIMKFSNFESSFFM